MISFRNDYSEGAHPKVLDAIARCNLEQACGYSTDPRCAAAKDIIRARFACPQADVHFLVGGTVTNTTVIAAALRPWEAVIAASTGHINVHETGAIESSGHKVCAIEAAEGKLTPAHVRAVMEEHCNGTDEHMVLPRMVYISQATELGTIYHKDELIALREVCREYGLYLFVDGARLAPALVAGGNDLAPEDYAKYCDVFYIGGTKNGLLFGEAMVIVNPALQKDFRYMMKHNGGMMAKGRLGGVMFLAALEHDDYFAWAKHANEMADIIRAGMENAGIPFFQKTTTNQIFAVLTEEQNAALELDFAYERWAKLEDGRVAVRFVTSWATEAADCEKLVSALEALA